MTTPINKNQMTEVGTLILNGYALTVTVDFEKDPEHMRRPTRAVVSHVDSDGKTQELVLDGVGVAGLQLLLGRVLGGGLDLIDYTNSPSGAPAGGGPLGIPRRRL